MAESRRLEDLWAGPFGNAYTERNLGAAAGREAFWRNLLAGIEVGNALEVGCNVGANLRWLAELLGPEHVTGIDVNETALERAAATLPGVRLRRASALELPFPDRAFDLVFTTGVLIHLAPDALSTAVAEIVRCSGRYVLCGEYFAKEPTEVAYRGQRGALHKRDFGALYTDLHPELRLVARGFLGKDQGWDDVTWWLFERAA